MASCKNVFAEPMLDDDAFLEKYATELKALQDEAVLPSDLKEKLQAYCDGDLHKYQKCLLCDKCVPES